MEKHEDQIEFYNCPICGTGTGNDVDGNEPHNCPREEEFVKSMTTHNTDTNEVETIRLAIYDRPPTAEDAHDNWVIAEKIINELVTTAKEQGREEEREKHNERIEKLKYAIRQKEGANFSDIGNVAYYYLTQASAPQR